MRERQQVQEMLRGNMTECRTLSSAAETPPRHLVARGLLTAILRDPATGLDFLLLPHPLRRIDLHPHEPAAEGDTGGHQQRRRPAPMIGRPGREAERNRTVVGLRGKEFGEQSEYLCACRVSDRSYALDQTTFVHSPNLIQDDLPGLPFESKRDTSRVGSAFRGHGSDDDRVDVLIHFIRRNDETGTGLPDFTALCGIQADEKDIEAGHYHVHSLRSHADIAADS